jgi:enoyl-CoA hydratase/carnithine racemase
MIATPTGSPSVSFSGDVALLHLGFGENRFTRDFLDRIDAALDVAEQKSETQALVTFGGDRFYCNGYDLAWLAAQSRDARRVFIRDYQRLLARLLVFPLPTVAAISGHAFGAGALLALAHDVRLLGSDRAAVCMPEIDARIPLRRAMWALLETRLSPAALRDVVLTGVPFAGAAAVGAGLVRTLVPQRELIERAVALATGLGGKDRRTRAALKAAICAEALEGLG